MPERRCDARARARRMGCSASERRPVALVPEGAAARTPCRWAGPARGAEGIAAVRDLVRAQGGAPESRVWAFGERAWRRRRRSSTAPWPRRSTSICVHDRAGVHSDIVVGPAVLAPGGASASGREFLVAYVEEARSSCACLRPREAGMVFTCPCLAVFGAAAGAARALRLDAPRTRHAMVRRLAGRRVHAQQALLRRAQPTKRLQPRFPRARRRRGRVAGGRRRHRAGANVRGRGWLLGAPYGELDPVAASTGSARNIASPP